MNFDGKEGYVFDGYLSSIPPLQVKLPTWFEETEKWAQKAFNLTPKLLRDDGCKDIEYTERQGQIKMETGCDGEGGCGYIKIWMKGRSFEECIMVATQIFGGTIVLTKTKSEIRISGDPEGYPCSILIKRDGDFILIIHVCCC